MTRLMGFVLLQLAAALFARGRIAEAAARTEALRSYSDMLEQLRGLLESDGSPMPALLETLSRRCTGQASAFVRSLSAAMDQLGERSFQELWQWALDGNADALDEDARRRLESLGGVLGRYDPATQLEALDTCRLHLRQRLDKRQSAQAQETHLILGLSFSASLLLGIYLI